MTSKYPRPCIGDCNRILRPATSSPEEYPTATMVHQAQGMCGACYRRYKRDPEKFAIKRSVATTRLERIRHENTVAGLARFLEARHQRLDRRKVAR